MGYLTFLAIAIIPIIVYGIIVLLEIPGLAQERLGELEPLPEDLNQWKPDHETEAGKAALARGAVREVRIWLDPAGGWLGRERLMQQVRYRNLKTDEIEAVEPDKRIRRKRRRMA